MISTNPPKPPMAPSLLFLILLAVSFVLFVVDSAKAEEALSPGRQAGAEQQAEFDPSQPPGPEDDWKFSLRMASIYKPAFVGSKDYQMMVVPDVKIEYQDRFFASLFDGVGYNVINSDGWRMGPIMKYDFGRSEDDDNPFRVAGEKTDALRGLGDVDGAVELGGFVEYTYESFSLMLELRQALGGHEGLVGETSLNYTGMTDQLGKPVMYAFGPRATFADANYNKAYFGISETQSAKSGLARYRAGDGLVSYGIGGFAMMPISDAVSLGVFGGYDRLASEAADSPLVKERGDENQFTLGVSLSYEF